MTTLTQTTDTSTRSIPVLAQFDQLLAKLAPVTGRIMIGGMFAYAGFGKITAYAGTQGYMESVGLPGALLPLVIAFEIGAGLALIAGWQTRIVAFLLAGFTLMTALMFHFDLADQVQSLFFFKNVAIAGGLLAFAGLGTGPLSLDQRNQS
ncbi:MAG: DoxX family protein [Pseudomonadota bacterium]